MQKSPKKWFDCSLGSLEGVLRDWSNKIRKKWTRNSHRQMNGKEIEFKNVDLKMEVLNFSTQIKIQLF